MCFFVRFVCFVCYPPFMLAQLNVRSFTICVRLCVIDCDPIVCTVLCKLLLHVLLEHTLTHTQARARTHEFFVRNGVTDHTVWGLVVRSKGDRVRL